MRYVIDIDDTICYYDEKTLDYMLAKPKLDRIKYINQLYDNGNEIVFQTARGFKTGIDWREVTENQFREWGVKYDELYFNKSYGDIYIDDKAMNDKDFFK